MPAHDQVITAYFEAKGWGKPTEVVSFPNVPGLYRAEFSDGAEYLAIQHDKVVTARGLAAAGAFLREAKVLDHAPSAKDLTTLLTLFEALPPTKVPAPDQFYDFPKHTELNPRLELANGAGKLTLCYLLPNAGHATAQPAIVRVTRWTLALGKDGKLAWRSEDTKFDTSK